MLTGSGNGTFSWTGPNGFTSNVQNPVVTVAGSYVLTVTGQNGCTSQAQADVILYDEAPGAQATGGTLTCSNTSVMLTGSGKSVPGFDVAISPSAGVIGFTVGDLRDACSGEMPDWVVSFFSDKAALLAAPRDEGVWL